MEFIVSSSILLVFLLCCSAFFSGSETSIFSLNRIQLHYLEQKGFQSAKIIRNFLEHPSKILVTILFGNQVVNILAASTAAALCVRFLGESIGPVVATVGMTLIILICGEVTPKMFAVQYPQKFAFFVCRPLRLFSQIVFPVRIVFTTIADTMLRFLGGTRGSHEQMVTGEEFRTLIDVSEREGVLEETERKMIDNIFDFSKLTVKEIMIPRTEMFCLALDDPFETILAKCCKELYSRLPVYQQTIDHIAGIVYVKDLLPFIQEESKDFQLRKFLREAYFVPETKKVQELLKEFQEKHIHIAIVVDGNGRTAGLICLEDILEEIVGEISDEFELEKVSLSLPVEEGKEYPVNAMMHIYDFNQKFGTYFSPDYYWTVGGLLLDLLGKVPQKGDTVTVGNLTLTVNKLRHNRIMEVIVKKEGE
jgi:putative hemolysin